MRKSWASHEQVQNTFSAKHRMFRAKINPPKKIFYTDNIHASVINCMSDGGPKQLWWESHDQVMSKLWASHEQVMTQKVAGKLQESCQKDDRKLQESCKKVAWKLPESWQKVDRKLTENYQKITQKIWFVLDIPVFFQKITHKKLNVFKIIQKIWLDLP